MPGDTTHVFEFRDPSWYIRAAYDLLERYGASFCVHDMPQSASKLIAVGPIVYVRFHGYGGKYWGRYPDATLLGWARWMVEQAKNGRSVWAYFNNDIDVHAIHDAQMLKSMIGISRR